MEPAKTTTIRVRETTKDKMAELKAPGQSYDGFITQMLEFWEKQKVGGAYVPEALGKD